MGLATQMIGWPEPFCRMLADAGHYVVRFDNRDVGQSTRMKRLYVPDVEGLMAETAAGRQVWVPYTLLDMADDTIGLMDALKIDRAHICGLSMGGMIAQVMALEYPARLLSLTSMMSTTGEPDLPPATEEALAAMMSSPPAKRAAYIDHMAEIHRTFAGGSPFYDEDLQRELSGKAFDRGIYAPGFLRQMAAIVGAGGRRHRLDQLDIPTLVIHGDIDPVVPLAHGQDTADIIPDARLEVIEGLGHGTAFPGLWEKIVAAISEHTLAAGA
jgi:pimeloyl-ACP methyl ester carboxylesterase